MENTHSRSFQRITGQKILQLNGQLDIFAGKEEESRGGKIKSTFTFHVNNISFDEKILLVPQFVWDAIVEYPNVVTHKKQKFTSDSSEGWEYEIGVPASSSSGDSPLPVSRCPLLFVSSRGGEQRGEAKLRSGSL